MRAQETQEREPDTRAREREPDTRARERRESLTRERARESLTRERARESLARERAREPGMRAQERACVTRERAGDTSASCRHFFWRQSPHETIKSESNPWTNPETKQSICLTIPIHPSRHRIGPPPRGSLACHTSSNARIFASQMQAYWLLFT